MTRFYSQIVCLLVFGTLFIFNQSFAVDVDRDWVTNNRAQNAPHWTFEEENTYTINDAGFNSVNFNGELHLEAGTTVIMEDDVNFDGADACMTTPVNGDRISFTAHWVKLEFVDGCDESYLDNVDFAITFEPIKIGNCDAFTFKNCTFAPVAGWGVQTYEEVEVYNNNEPVLFTGCTFDNIGLVLDCAEAEVYGCDFTFIEETPLLINGECEAVIRGFSTFEYDDAEGGALYCIEINPSPTRGWWTVPTSVEIYDCELTRNTNNNPPASGILITSFPTNANQIVIYRNLIHQVANGISIDIDAANGDGAGGIVVRNNLIETCSSYGIRIDDELEGAGIQIFNNIIHNISVDGIFMEDFSDPDVRYNTISNAVNCVRVERCGNEQIYDNVFSLWTNHAVIYTNLHDGFEPVDFNVYCTPSYAAEPGNGYTFRVDSPGGNPTAVFNEKDNDADAWQYFPWGEENDDLDCALRDATASPYDFHLIGTRPSYPSWLNQDSQDITENDRPVMRPGLWPRRTIRRCTNSQGDAGAYGGTYSEGFVIGDEYGAVDFEDEYATMWEQYITDEITNNSDHFGDPFVWITEEQLQWLYDGGEAPEDEYYRAVADLEIDDGDDREIPADCCIAFDDGNGLIVAGVVDINGVFGEPVELLGYGTNWDGVTFTSTSDIANCDIDYLTVKHAYKGLNLVNADDALGNKLIVNNCTFDSCGYGVYINNSRVKLKDCDITNTDDGYYGNAVYMASCTSGKVIMDGCTITDNGVGSDYNSAAVYLSSSDPEIVNCTIEDNSGCGIACFGSNPDLDTYDSAGNKINYIHANGPGTQSSYYGAEIYLASSSYPTINYNNIWDFDTSPIGIMIYKDDPSNSSAVNAKYCWWGGTPSASYFYWGSCTAIDYSSSSSMKLSNSEEYELAMGYWNLGEYEDAARIFRRTVYDIGSVGVNSVHYLSGCVSEMEDGNFVELRSFLQEVAAENEDEEVARVASRFATHCQTELREYEDAMAEYDHIRSNAECVRDSIMAVIDYLVVSELACDYGDLDAYSSNIQKEMHDLMKLLQDRTESGNTEILLPEDFIIVEAYPNPFNSSTTIDYNLSESGKVKLSIHDLHGREVAVLDDGMQAAGNRKAIWNAGDRPSGIYLCILESNNKIATQKLTLIR